MFRMIWKAAKKPQEADRPTEPFAAITQYNDSFMRLNAGLMILAIFLYAFIGILVITLWWGDSVLESVYFMVITFTTGTVRTVRDPVCVMAVLIL
jgi:hypothetical protein